MFKNIPLKKAKIITAIICILIGIILCIVELYSVDNLFSLEAFLGIILAISLPGFFYMAIYLSVFAKREGLEHNICYAQSILSKDEYKKINLKLENNEFAKLSIEESTISYYAKIKSDKEIEISIRKDENEISNKIIDVYCFKRFFTK